MTPAALRRACVDVLGSISRHAAGRNLVAISPLAEGADRVFAEAALTCDYQLQALLPFTRTDYETTFENRADLHTYRHLLARSSQITELAGQLSQTKNAYAAVGAGIVQASDIILAVWDGEPAAGKGGTPDVIMMALTAGRLVIWIDAHGASETRLLRSTDADAFNLETAQRFAPAATDIAIAEFIAALLSGH